jgi:hypothetical protein
MDVTTLGIVAGVVALLAIVLYVWDRRSKQQPVDVIDAAKLAVGVSTVAGGVAYAVTGVDDVVEQVVDTAQEMFVGKPEF